MQELRTRINYLAIDKIWFEQRTAEWSLRATQLNHVLRRINAEAQRWQGQLIFLYIPSRPSIFGAKTYTGLRSKIFSLPILADPVLVADPLVALQRGKEEVYPFSGGAAMHLNEVGYRIVG